MSDNYINTILICASNLSSNSRSTDPMMDNIRKCKQHYKHLVQEDSRNRNLKRNKMDNVFGV